jgi:hypothetical protein
LVRLGTGKEFFYIANGSKHSIPNWDTFVYMNLDARKVNSLGGAEFDEIPRGEPLPPCTNC